jgi:hypothetical protein
MPGWQRCESCNPEAAEATCIKADNRLAVFCLIAFALLVFGLIVENYWNCRLLRHQTMKQCEPLIGGKWGPGLYLPVKIFPAKK